MSSTKTRRVSNKPEAWNTFDDDQKAAAVSCHDVDFPSPIWGLEHRTTVLLSPLVALWQVCSAKTPLLSQRWWTCAILMNIACNAWQTCCGTFKLLSVGDIHFLDDIILAKTTLSELNEIVWVSRNYIRTINYFGGTKIVQNQNKDMLFIVAQKTTAVSTMSGKLIYLSGLLTLICLICSSNCWFNLYSKPSRDFIHSVTCSLPFTSKCCPAIYPDACYWRRLLSINFLCHLYGFYLFVFPVWNGARALLRWMDYNSKATTHQSSKFDFLILTQLLLSYYCATLSRSMAF